METQIDHNTKRINLGNGNVEFTDDAMRKLSYLMGSLFIIAALSIFFSNLDDETLSFRALITGIPQLLFGLLLIFKGPIELSPKSKYAPHFAISGNGLKIKTGILKRSQFIAWEDIKGVEFGTYQIGIKDIAGFQYFRYKTERETSIELKNAIEAMATQKGIGVVHV